MNADAQQHHLALMISEAVVNLYRSHFMRALNQDPGDPLRSQYGQPFLLVVERSNVSRHPPGSSFTALTVAGDHSHCMRAVQHVPKRNIPPLVVLGKLICATQHWTI